MTQIGLLVSNYFLESAQVYAILNFVKTMVMASIILIASHISTHGDFRVYYLSALILALIFQAYLLMRFNFADTLKSRQDCSGLLDDKEGGPPAESEMKHLIK